MDTGMKKDQAEFWYWDFSDTGPNKIDPKIVGEYISFKDYILLEDDGVEEIKKDPVKTTLEDKDRRKKIREIASGMSDSVSFKKDGTIAFKQGYYYRPQYDVQQFADGIKKTLEKKGFKIEMVNVEDRWAPYPRDSYYLAVLRVK